MLAMTKVIVIQTLFAIVFFTRGTDNFDMLICSPATVTS